MRAFSTLGTPCTLRQVYAHVAETGPEHVATRPNWRARIRATLQGSQRFVRVGSGTWDFRDNYTAEEVEHFEAKRHALYPNRGPRRKDENQ